MEAGSLATTIRGDRALTARSPRSRAIDPLLKWVLSGLAALILVLIAFFFIEHLKEGLVETGFDLA